MLNFANLYRKSRSGINWFASNFYSNCDLIQAAQLPRTFKVLPGKSNFAFLFTANNLYFIDKVNNTFTLIQISPQKIENLKMRLGIEFPLNLPPLYLIEEEISNIQLRKILRKVDVAPPLNFVPLWRTVILFGVFGFIPNAWTFGFPVLVLYGLVKQRALGRALYNFRLRAKHFRQNYHHIAGEKASDLLRNQLSRVLRGAAGVFTFFSIGCFGFFSFFAGFNGWSAIALYGVYRYTPKEGEVSLQDWANSISHFIFGFTQQMTFYRKMASFMGLAMIFSWISSSFGAISFPLSIINTVFLIIGSRMIIRDLVYVYRNLLKVFFNNSGKILGAHLGRWIAYRALSGHLTGSLGPVTGYVFTPGIFSGFFSSFLSPTTSFVMGRGGIVGAAAASVQTTLMNVLTGIFFTSEMQIQGIFSGTLGPTSFQIYTYMFVGYFVGWAIECLVARVGQTVIDDVSFVNNTENVSNYFQQQSRELVSQHKGHIFYFSVATALLMCSPAGASLVAFSQGSVLAGSMLGFSGLLFSWNIFEYAASGISYLRNRSQRQPAQRHGPAQPFRRPEVEGIDFSKFKPIGRPAEQLARDEPEEIGVRHMFVPAFAQANSIIPLVQNEQSIREAYAQDEQIREERKAEFRQQQRALRAQ